MSKYEYIYKVDLGKEGALHFYKRDDGSYYSMVKTILDNDENTSPLNPDLGYKCNTIAECLMWWFSDETESGLAYPEGIEAFLNVLDWESIIAGKSMLKEAGQEAREQLEEARKARGHFDPETHEKFISENPTLKYLYGDK